eukprot:TRINITY_DN62269_c0_g1_i1.p1 TRINITY_DN62269_c0_g1~~TRINITY_DN62269_c0_g1_i1.p1  ORF type:complete len:183 (-),score=32.26 TRINITY_DN62269_c0_g1_i1:59-583(-)
MASDDSTVQLRVGMRVELVGLQARPDLNGTTGNLKSYDATKERWAVQLDSGEGVKLFKAANFKPLEVAESPMAEIQGDVMKRQLEAAVNADKKYSAERSLTQRVLPSGRDGVLDPIMWHITKNICEDKPALARYTMSCMASMLKKPEQAGDLPLDDASLDARVANFLKAFRDAA